MSTLHNICLLLAVLSSGCLRFYSVFVPFSLLLMRWKFSVLFFLVRFVNLTRHIDTYWQVKRTAKKIYTHIAGKILSSKRHTVFIKCERTKFLLQTKSYWNWIWIANDIVMWISVVEIQKPRNWNESGKWKLTHRHKHHERGLYFPLEQDTEKKSWNKIWIQFFSHFHECSFFQVKCVQLKSEKMNGGHTVWIARLHIHVQQWTARHWTSATACIFVFATR